MMNTAVVLQCRLSSSRLPKKALLPMGSRTVFERVLISMKKVSASFYIVATDEQSAPFLEPLAKPLGYDVFAGSLNDVLNRYCSVIKKYNIDVVLRGTCDNPFLFSEAAQELLLEFCNIKDNEHIDYMTYTGLPHGSGVEVFSAASLLKAESLTSDPYDHEHVGPSLYNHPKHFKSLFKPCRDIYNFPSLRTTVDTVLDYRRNLIALDDLGCERESFTFSEIINAFKKDYVRCPFIFYPCIKKGHGTGHLRRCLDLALNTGGHILIDKEEGNTLENLEPLLKSFFDAGLKKSQIQTNASVLSEYETVFCDLFVADGRQKKLLQNCNVVAIDEGSLDKNFCDFTFDVLPPLKQDSNFLDPLLIPLPKNVKTSRPSSVKKVLVCVGGEDPLQLGLCAKNALLQAGFDVTYVSSSSPVQNLKETLFEYDAVVTHFGFTAFEALFSGCNVVLVASSSLHKKLSKKYGFTVLQKHDITKKTFQKLFSDTEKLFNKKFDSCGGYIPRRRLKLRCESAAGFVHFLKNESKTSRTLYDVVKSLLKASRYSCPVCGTRSHKNPVIARTESRTFRQCKECKMKYISFSSDCEKTEYNHDYFFDSYRAQYGKTYLEDFDSIKKQGLRRANVILKMLSKKGGTKKSVLDVGCAMGPFLKAAGEKGFEPYGTDISSEAVEYVKNTLGIKAAVSCFPDFDSEKLFNCATFDSLTMWYVIEHFKNAGDVLLKVSSLVKKGGVFAFATPCAQGLSSRFNTKSFYKASPSDHFTLWDIKSAKKILPHYGFKIEKIVSTGIHPERFSFAKNVKPGSLIFNVLKCIIRLFKWGDTFELYCRKVE